MSGLGGEPNNSIKAEKQSKGRINIFLFAAHHASGNIAAQRFKSLTKYLDSALFQIHVFTRSPNMDLPHSPVSETSPVSVHVLDGQCVGREAPPLVLLIVFLAALFRKLPFIVGLLKKSDKFSSCWMMNALVLANSICQTKISNGEKCFVIGTYSPIDALIASCCLSAKFELPYMQDFRDGFVFESLGRKGKVASWLRAVIERRVVQPATLVTSVSSAIVNDFRIRYPGLRVELLANGYDPVEFTAMNRVEVSSHASAIIVDIPKDKIIVGHFGRISDSDHSRLSTFKYFIQILRKDNQLSHKVHLVFVGKLTAVEDNLLKELGCSKTILPMIDRSLAQELMSQCNILLLITGDSVGCATGKLFEYMATGRDILCFSGVRNEATRILEETGTGKTIIINTTDGVSFLFEELCNLQRTVREVPRDISAYNRKHQAVVLGDWIKKACQ